MEHSRRTWAVLAALVVLALAMAGCSGGGRPGSGGDAPAATENDINPVARDQLADGGTLRWPLSGFPANFNYNELNGPDADNAAVLGALLPGPFEFDAAAQPILQREYVEFAEVTATDPKQVVTYRINPKAVWYDGTPITVADFEAQWKALNGSNPAFRVASTQGYDKVERVAKGRDEREVIVTFKTKYADWRALFGALYPASTNADPNVFNDGWKQQPLTTAGPFKLDSVDRTAKTITLVRNEKWWGRPAKLERIIYRVIDGDAQVDALANGEIDFIDIGSNVNNFQRAQAIQGVTLRRAGGPNFSHITINGTSEVLEDVRVRQAIAMGIDRGRIAQALIAPLGVPPTPLGNHIFMANQKGYEDNSGDLGEYNPEAARARLDEAGWKLDGGVRAKDGKQLAIRFVIPAQVAQTKQMAELVQGMLGEVGVKVEIETVPGDDFSDKYIAPGNFDLTAFAWLGTPFPISSSKSIYASPKPGPDGQLDVQQNYARVGSDEIDRLFDQATAELDTAKAVQLANEIDAKIWQEVHSLVLYQRPEIVATNTNLANFGAFGFASGAYEDIGFTKL
ncbi:MAG: ABC transporter family substrate-binding protein [Egibacteraceae bacterium]